MIILLADILPYIEHAAVSSIESIFLILGFPSPSLRKTALSEEKFVKTAMDSMRGQLGVLIDTHALTISINPDKRKILHKLLSQFGPHRKAFTIKEMAPLVGIILVYLSLCSTWTNFCSQ